MYGYIKLNGNVIEEAGASSPAKWLPRHVHISKMVASPESLIGKYYDPVSCRVYEEYVPSSGKYSDSVLLTEQDATDLAVSTAVANAENKFAGELLEVVNQFINSGKAVTESEIPVNVTEVFEKQFGKGKYKLGKAAKDETDKAI